MNFDQAFDRLIGNEGGYVNNPADPGGETQWGISKRAYPNVNIRDLTREQAKAIYRRDVWQRASLDQFAPALAFQVFDAAVNHGVTGAIMMLQRAAGVADDGHVGPLSIEAIKAKPAPVLVMLFVAERIDFWTKLSTWVAFGKGWARRAAADLRYGAGDVVP